MSSTSSVMTSEPPTDTLVVMPTEPSQFSPFLSLGLLKASSNKRSVSRLLQQIQKAIFSHRPKSETSGPKGVKQIGKFEEASVEGQGFMYRVQETPSWWRGAVGEASNEAPSDPSIINSVRHLVLLLKLGEVFAVYTSHPSDWGRVVRGIKDGQVQKMKLMPAELINGAFTNRDWAMGTVWMKGLHNPVETKADSKQLTGSNVRSAIDPFGDQTYHFSSGRSNVPVGDGFERLGLSPAKHRIWLGQSTDFTDFCERAHWAMGCLTEAPTIATPIEELAQPLSSLESLECPDEVGWAPHGDRASWTAEASEAFDMVEGVSLELDAICANIIDAEDSRAIEVVLGVVEQGESVAEMILEIRYSKISNFVAVGVKATSSDGELTTWEAAIDTIFQDEGWGNLRYENGCVVSGHVAYRPHYSAKRFTNWTWIDFQALGNVDITKEKPIRKGETDGRKVDLDRIGETSDDSLFTWICTRWGSQRDGRLLCDDGGGEIADFLHLAPPDSDGESTLTLIHAKASRSAEADRGLSVSDYEVVVAQAIKNLAYASPTFVVEKLRTLSGTAKGWLDGVKGQNSSQFADDLSSRGHKVRLRVVVIQPQTLRSKYESDLNGASASLKNRHAQLSALLLEAEATCRNVGASFSIVAAQR